MSFIAAFICSGFLLISVFLLVHWYITSRPPRANRCIRKGTNVLPPPSPACERVWRLVE